MRGRARGGLMTSMAAEGLGDEGFSAGGAGQAVHGNGIGSCEHCSRHRPSAFPQVYD